MPAASSPGELTGPGDPGDSAGEPAPLSNADLARIFHEIGDLLEVKGEVVYKTVAYHRAADAIAHTPVHVAAAYRAGAPPRIPGVGAAIGEKLRELALTGHLTFHDRLRAEVPPSLLDLLAVPGIGPKTVRVLYRELGIESLEDLRRSAEAGHLRTLRGMSERTEESILEGLATLSRRSSRLLLGTADRWIEEIRAALETTPGLRSIVPAGSFRRGRDTVGDLDLLAATDRPDVLIDAFVALPAVDRILNRGSQRAAVQLALGPQVDLMIMPPGSEGSYLVHFTGSKAHNVRLRSRARDQGWSLSEKGYVPLDADDEAPHGASPEPRTFATEAEVYEFVGLPFIEPELREDRGEIEAALEGRLPELVAPGDLRGDLHTHSDWSDGVHEIAVMAEAARRRGYAYLVLTDHSFSLAIARGLTVERVALQRAVVAGLNARFAREEEEGRAPAGSSAEGFRLLHGCELEVRADGRLDFDDDVLAAFDLVVAAVHVSRRQPRAQLTQRTLNAIRSPHVDVIAHPSGRMIGASGRDELDLDWDEIYAEAAATGTVLEINGSDHRMDLSDERARRAVELGCLVAIDSDAHRTEELEFVRWGTLTARRAWIEPRRILNVRPRGELLDWVAGKPARVAGRHP